MISCSNDRANLFVCQLSHKQVNHVHEFLRDNLTSTQFRVFNTLMELTVKHERVFPSLGTLARLSSCARSTVQIAINKFKDLNIITAEYRGYHKSLIFKMHEFYYAKRFELTSFVRNVVKLSLFFLLSRKGNRSDRYLLEKNTVVYLNQRAFSGYKSMANLQLTDEHYLEIRKHPGWVYERAQVLYQRKIDSGLAVCNPARYFMGIFKQEAAKTQATVHRQQDSKFLKKTETKPFVRPTDGPYAIYRPEEKRVLESDFEISLKLETTLHSKPNTFTRIVADMNLKKLTAIEIDRINDMVHQNCTCRPQENC